MILEEQRGRVVEVFDSGAKGPWFNSWDSPINLFSCRLTLLLHLTGGADAVDDEDIMVSSDQGNA